MLLKQNYNSLCKALADGGSLLRKKGFLAGNPSPVVNPRVASRNPASPPEALHRSHLFCFPPQKEVSAGLSSGHDVV